MFSFIWHILILGLLQSIETGMFLFLVKKKIWAFSLQPPSGVLVGTDISIIFSC